MAGRVPRDRHLHDGLTYAVRRHRHRPTIELVRHVAPLQFRCYTGGRVILADECLVEAEFRPRVEVEVLSATKLLGTAHGAGVGRSGPGRRTLALVDEGPLVAHG